MATRAESVRALLAIPDEQIIAMYEAAPLLRHVEELAAHVVTNARNHGATWADVGDAFGITRAAAHARYGTAGS